MQPTRSRHADRPSFEGRQLGCYQFLSPLGSGGMGDVYRAKDTKLGREVAIKVLPPAFAHDPGRLARFRREAQLLASLSHPNIAVIHGLEEFDDVHFLVLELVDGKTLQEILAEGPMLISTALDVAVQIAAALARAHEATIVHRDLKPQNVMIRNDGLVKILDFGLSKLAPQVPQSPSEMKTGITETLPGQILGTVPYMSPQQAAGKSVDYRSDQFSFGSILYEIVTGKRPFHRATAVQTLAAIIEDEPEAIASINPDVPAALQAIIQRCMAKNPAGRYSSTGDLVRELRRLRDQIANAGDKFLPVHAGPAEKQLAVLPFTNIGSDPGNQPFCDGLVEILTSKLSQLEQFQSALQVVPASEVRNEGITSAREAREAFGVTLAVTGSVQRAGERIRVTINLVDPGTLRQLKARSIDTEVHDVSVLQDGIVLEVVELLDVKLPPQAKQMLSAGGTTVPGAYEFYLQGRGYLQRYEKVENVQHAIALFERALEKDPKYAVAHAGLGEAYWRRYEFTKDLQWLEHARKSCAMATELNNKLAPVHVTLGLIDRATGKYEEAVARLHDALSIDPLNPDAYMELANTYEMLGNLQEAESTFKRAIAVRPNYWASQNELGRFYYRLGRYTEAELQFRRVIELTPDNARAYSNLGAIYCAQGRYDEAAAMIEKAVVIRPKDETFANLGTIYFYQGRFSDAARIFERALEMNDRSYGTWRNLAAAYEWSPTEREKAAAAFERAAKLAEDERRINPRRPNLLVHLADCYSNLGQSQRARDLLEEALTLSSPEVTTMFNAAVVYEQLGDRSRALEWIRKALQHGFSRDLVERAPSLAQLRADPEFKNESSS